MNGYYKISNQFWYKNLTACYKFVIRKKDYQNYDALYEDKEYDQGDDGLVPQEGAPIVSEEFYPLEPLTTDKDIEVNGSGFGSIPKELDFAGQLETPNVLTTVNDLLLDICFAFSITVSLLYFLEGSYRRFSRKHG